MASAAACASRATARGMLSSAKRRSRVSAAGAGAGVVDWVGLGAARLRRPTAEEEDMEVVLKMKRFLVVHS